MPWCSKFKIFDDYLSIEGKNEVESRLVILSVIKTWLGNERKTGPEIFIGQRKSTYIPARLTSYNTLFLDGDVYRENCYACPYARKERVSDMTIGDFWGIEREHPELLKQSEFDEKRESPAFW